MTAQEIVNRRAGELCPDAIEDGEEYGCINGYSREYRPILSGPCKTCYVTGRKWWQLVEKCKELHSSVTRHYQRGTTVTCTGYVPREATEGLALEMLFTIGHHLVVSYENEQYEVTVTPNGYRLGEVDDLLEQGINKGYTHSPNCQDALWQAWDKAVEKGE